MRGGQWSLSKSQPLPPKASAKWNFWQKRQKSCFWSDKYIELRPLSSFRSAGGMHPVHTKYAMSAVRNLSRHIGSVQSLQIKQSQISHVKSAPSQLLRHFWQPFVGIWVTQLEQSPVVVSICCAQVGQRTPPSLGASSGQWNFCLRKRQDRPQAMHLWASAVGCPGLLGPITWWCCWELFIFLK